MRSSRSGSTTASPSDESIANQKMRSSRSSRATADILARSIANQKMRSSRSQAKQQAVGILQYS